MKPSTFKFIVEYLIDDVIKGFIDECFIKDIIFVEKFCIQQLL